MLMIDELKRMEPELQAIIDKFPNEEDAAPELRKLAIKHRQRRYRVFGAYRVLKQERESK